MNLKISRADGSELRAFSVDEVPAVPPWNSTMIDDRKHHMVANFLVTELSRRVVIDGDDFDALCVADILNRYRPGCAEVADVFGREYQEAKLKSGRLQFLLEPSKSSESED